MIPWQSIITGVAVALLVSYLVLVNTLFELQAPFEPVRSRVQTSLTLDDFPIDVGFEGPTKIGKPSSLRNANPIDGATSPYVTNYTINGQKEGDNVQHLWGSLSPYFISDGFGVEESALPSTCKVKQAHILSRHGARYPTAGSFLLNFAAKLKAADYHASGALKFLNDWQYELGEAVLVPIGKQQLYDSGVLTSMQYGGLYNHLDIKNKLVFRTTSQKRMKESAIAFLEGFFGGQDWVNHANLEVIIEEGGYNNTLAPYMVCPNSNKQMFGSGNRKHWESLYLANKTAQFSELITGIEWTVRDTAALQLLCPYETVANGYSQFCELFDMREWHGFDYAESLWFEQNCAFGAPTGRAQGIGWVNELIRRLEKAPYEYATQSSENSTLDDSSKYFPLDQNLYVDFTHDSVISSVVAALDFTQFNRVMPRDGPIEGEDYYSTSKIHPFAARLAVEVIDCDGTDYVHFTLNQRTVPVNATKYGAGYRSGDGWAKLSDWLHGMSDRNELASWDRACFGEYPTDGKQFSDGRPDQ
ncbi:protein of unknown function [Taphrina deformans PYCC 5710]|uniref:3-phytase n=1 Tax=Taphrina deformans (strain PYCC 5710 / ATCC 11124 / CBS 356.35 / IMI 108563 / JCM 9778 / NBRC 8474) TaxID=1097556 RepID=R4XDQ9_TAPDE|nr:protein of unknown function [Taphrina deformans PYCC 5710]|eukprot:CCG83757.1 protein of unknown function [Taphrina deformans PYCC 5710]